MSHAGQRTVEALALPSGKEYKLSIVHNPRCLDRRNGLNPDRGVVSAGAPQYGQVLEPPHKRMGFPYLSPLILAEG